MEIKDYFLQYSNELAYLELKPEWEASQKTIQDLDLQAVPLPIITSDFTQGIREGTFDEELDFKYFIRGIVWNLGIDPEFKYREEYLEIMRTLVKKPWRFAIQMGVDYIQKRQKEDLKDPKEEDISRLEKDILAHGLIAFRASWVIAPDEPEALTSYGGMLWRADGGKDGEDYIRAATDLLEKAIRIDPDYVQAHIGLGDLNAHTGHYLKAQSFYKQGLAVAEDERQIDVIRQLMAEIEDRAALEDAIYYIHKADYSRAIESLLEAKKNSNRYDVDYYLGICYMNLGRFDPAIAAFESAVEKGGRFGSLFNDLVYSLNAGGRQDDALAYANIGLKEEPSNIRLRYNRAVILTDRGELDKAEEDLDFLLEYADLSDDMVNLSMTLKEEIKRLKGEGA